MIIFIQEPPRFLIRRTPSHTNPMGDLLYGTPNHLEWTLFIYQDPSQNNYTRVTTYVNKHLARMRFILQLDIINYHDINVLVFHNDRDINLMINIYSDNNQTVLQVLCQNITNMDNTVILTGDFNIRDSDWDPNFQHHSTHTDNLITIADSLGLELFLPSNSGPTRFADNLHDANSVIDLIFFPLDNTGFSQHILYPEIQKLSDHVPLIIEVGIGEINTNVNIWSIKKDSEEEKNFITPLIHGVKNLNTSAIRSKENLKNLV